MLFLSVLISMFMPAHLSSSVPIDSVKIHFTFDKKESANSAQTNYYYHVSIQNNSDQAVYVILPKWVDALPAVKGIMNSVNVDSHDSLEEYSLQSDPSFEIYKVEAHSTFIEQSCKIRAHTETVSKLSKIDIPIFLADEVKIGELKLNEYVDHKDFYGNNIPYKIVGANTTHETIALK
jgi:hypothetical protein